MIFWNIRFKVDFYSAYVVKRHCRPSSSPAIIGKLSKLWYHLMQRKKRICWLDLVLAPTNSKRNLRVGKILESTSKREQLESASKLKGKNSIVLIKSW